MSPEEGGPCVVCCGERGTFTAGSRPTPAGERAPGLLGPLSLCRASAGGPKAPPVTDRCGIPIEGDAAVGCPALSRTGPSGPAEGPSGFAAGAPFSLSEITMAPGGPLDPAGGPSSRCFAAVGPSSSPARGPSTSDEGPIPIGGPSRPANWPWGPSGGRSCRGGDSWKLGEGVASLPGGHSTLGGWGPPSPFGGPSGSAKGPSSTFGGPTGPEAAPGLTGSSMGCPCGAIGGPLCPVVASVCPEGAPPIPCGVTLLIMEREACGAPWVLVEAEDGG